MYLAPAYLAEIGATAPKAGFVVYAAQYPLRDGSRVPTLAFTSRTLKAAFRDLGSIADHRGKLYSPSLAVAFIMSADGETLSWNETKARLRAELESV